MEAAETKKPPFVLTQREDFTNIRFINFNDKYTQFTVVAIPASETNNTTAITFNISANRQDEEPQRLERLIRVSKWLTNYFWTKHFSDIASIDLHDHKGHLMATVIVSKNFQSHRNDFVKAAIQNAWSNAKESAENIFIIIGRI